MWLLTFRQEEIGELISEVIILFNNVALSRRGVENVVCAWFILLYVENAKKK